MILKKKNSNRAAERDGAWDNERDGASERSRRSSGYCKILNLRRACVAVLPLGLRPSPTPPAWAHLTSAYLTSSYLDEVAPEACNWYAEAAEGPEILSREFLILFSQRQTTENLNAIVTDTPTWENEPSERVSVAKALKKI